MNLHLYRGWPNEWSSAQIWQKLECLITVCRPARYWIVDYWTVIGHIDLWQLAENTDYISTYNEAPWGLQQLWFVLRIDPIHFLTRCHKGATKPGLVWFCEFWLFGFLYLWWVLYVWFAKWLIIGGKDLCLKWPIVCQVWFISAVKQLWF